MLTLRDATVHFDGAPRPALNRVSLEIHQGSWTAIVGPNGSGKSTLLSALAGLLPLGGGIIERIGPVRVALLQQDADNQLIATTVQHELALSVPVDVPPGEAAARIAAAIDRFHLGELLLRNPHQLSGGEKQRVACATVWLEEPDLLLLDEPLAFLDRAGRQAVIDFVRENHARGAAVVWATPGDDVNLAHRIVALEDGSIVPNAAIESAPTGGDEPRRRVARTSGDVIVEVRGARFAYGERTVLDGVDLTIARGECAGILGDNGAGKTTLLLLLGGALRPSSGAVTSHAREHGVLYLPQSPERMFFAETVREEVLFGLRRRRSHPNRDAGALESIARASVEAAGLDPAMLDRSPFDLSGGEMRRVAFAIAFALEPELLLLDEPSTSLDAAGRSALRRLVDGRLNAGGAVVVASHDPVHLHPVCDRTVELQAGRIASV